MPILDAQGRKMKVMPTWHRDIRPGCLVQWCGHWFVFEGIDPDHDPNIVFFRWKEPTKATKRRENAKRN